MPAPIALLLSVLAALGSPSGGVRAGTFPDGKVNLRMPDAVGNLFKTADKSDRKYGPAGQLLESSGPDGVTRHEYDQEGNLTKKLLPDGGEWKYEWNGAGMLARVLRPDGRTVGFGYDALGRRVWKKYGAKTTKWMWDGNVPVHEWVEVDPSVENPPPEPEAVADDNGLTARKFMLTKRFAQGPPPEGAGTAEAPITWVFEPESFAPLAKLTASGRYGIVTDHLGTPTAMLDEQGSQVWSANIGVYGELRNVVGDKRACPFRWPGQYEDEETGLYYNRFRYYDPTSGAYTSQDPIGPSGGMAATAYVADPTVLIDPMGLAGCKANTAVLRPGTRFEMAFSPGQAGTDPGRFGTFDRIKNKAFVRNDLAVKQAWKPGLDRVVTFEVTKPMPALQGTVGPQVDHAAGHVLPGGASQIEMQVPPGQRMNYLRIVGIRSL